jgi:hypothetical protein
VLLACYYGEQSALPLVLQRKPAITQEGVAVANRVVVVLQSVHKYALTTSCVLGSSALMAGFHCNSTACVRRIWHSTGTRELADGQRRSLLVPCQSQADCAAVP